jgi:cytochrome c-type biogenesis protein CcmE
MLELAPEAGARATPSRALSYCGAMDPSRKRKVRLVVALGAAVLLATALVWTSFSASSDATTPSQLAASAVAGKSYQLTGKVADGSYRRQGSVHVFRVRDRAGTTSVPVRYEGSVPDPFREGREVIVKVRKQGTTFVGEKDSLITKCPSKFSKDQQS